MTDLAISVITPSFRAATFLGDAVRSVELQPGVLEHLIQDNVSRDGSHEIASSSSLVRWYEERDRGQSDALNRALQRARGRWIAWLNADEFYLPNGLARLVEHAERHNLDVAYGEAVFVDAEGRFLRALAQHRRSKHALWWYGMFISSCATIVRADVLGGYSFDTALRRVMDWDMALHLAEAGHSFGHVPIPVAAFRVHDDQVTSAPAEAFAEEYERLESRYSHLGRRRQLAGRGLHALMKARSGAYRRQLRCRRCRGADMRWFDPSVGYDGVRLLDEAYAPWAGHPAR